MAMRQSSQSWQVRTQSAQRLLHQEFCSATNFSSLAVCPFMCPLQRPFTLLKSGDDTFGRMPCGQTLFHLVGDRPRSNCLGCLRVSDELCLYVWSHLFALFVLCLCLLLGSCHQNLTSQLNELRHGACFRSLAWQVVVLLCFSFFHPKRGDALVSSHEGTDFIEGIGFWAGKGAAKGVHVGVTGFGP